MTMATYAGPLPLRPVMASMYFSSTSSHWPIVPRSLLTTIRSSSVTFPSQQYAVKDSPTKAATLGIVLTNLAPGAVFP